ncbi:MAG: hypothetical protein VKI82_15180 [Leptolyngbya sp.]|nr:hypothetical protein [Leptolyngbya sp.]
MLDQSIGRNAPLTHRECLGMWSWCIASRMSRYVVLVHCFANAPYGSMERMNGLGIAVFPVLWQPEQGDYQQSLILTDGNVTPQAFPELEIAVRRLIEG